ncbi:hypothetical protein M9Y10_002175 [Tritrichomonas musculus]|uniref:Surface antigen BspA-like n=1 Tax=Tritrichomonas musculus TaxID=1915356 RepID=A0ABR2LAP8_9EUKA
MFLATYLAIPSSVKSIRELAFDGCYNLNDITIESSDISIERFAFNSSRVIKLHFNAFSIPDEMFMKCIYLIKISILSPVLVIGKRCFEDCNKLKEINLPSSLTTIEKYAFNNCSSLETITIPPSVTLFVNALSKIVHY